MCAQTNRVSELCVVAQTAVLGLLEMSGTAGAGVRWLRPLEKQMSHRIFPHLMCARTNIVSAMRCCVKCSVTTKVDLRISWSKRQMTELTEETESHIAFSFPPHVCSTSKYSFCIMRCCGKWRRRGQLELRRQLTELIVESKSHICSAFHRMCLNKCNFCCKWKQVQHVD